MSEIPEPLTLAEAASRVLNVYHGMEDGDGNPCPDLAALRRALSSPSPSTEQGVVTDEMVETASKAYADHTEYYIKFHRGLSSPSANKIRAGMRKALEAALSASHPPKDAIGKGSRS